MVAPYSPAPPALLVRSAAATPSTTASPPSPFETLAANHPQEGNPGLGIASAMIAVSLAMLSHGKLSQMAQNGQLLKLCQQADAKLPWLNTQLGKIRLPKSALLDKVLTRTSTQTLVKQALAPHLSGATTWASKHLPTDLAKHWQTQLSQAHTLDDVLKAVDSLRDETAKLPRPQKALDMLNSLAKRAKEGIGDRYVEPYRHTRELIHQGKLGPVGQTLLHFMQSTRQLAGGDFAAASLGQKPTIIAPLLSGLLVFTPFVNALMQADWPDKLKRAGEELFGNAYGNFVGWYWGTHWLNHWGGIPRVLNKIKPGLANRPFLMGTNTGFFTELIAALLVGNVLAKLGTGASHSLLGKPRSQYTPKLPPNYQPLQRHLALSQETPLPQSSRLTQLSDNDLKALMTNPHAITERQVINQLKPELQDLMAPGGSVPDFKKATDLSI
jgi:hypothetical protein